MLDFLNNDWRYGFLWLSFYSQLKLSHPDHLLVKRVSAAEENFERALQTVAWKMARNV